MSSSGFASGAATRLRALDPRRRLRFLNRNRGWCWLPLLFVAALAVACRGAPPPVVAGLPAAVGASVVVLVPGITGSVLEDETTGKVAWGSAASLFLPHDGGRGLALPVVGSAARALVAREVIADIPLAFGAWKKEVYGPIVDLMAANGLPTGNLLRPRARDRFFVFPYDWRQDNITTAEELGQRLEELAALRPGGPLRVSLLCQSNGAHICRWLAKAGRASLEEVERGEPKPLAGVELERLILIGTSNGGSLRILREMNRGRSYVPVVGRRWEPEALFTMPALYQDLPFDSRELFVDEAGQPLAVDLYEAENWWRYGWSIWGKETAARLRRDPFAALGSEAQRREFLVQALDRARRFHRLLERDSSLKLQPRLYLLQSLSTPTAHQAVLTLQKGRWHTFFTGDRWLEERPRLAARVTRPGDEHATQESQLALSPQEQAAMAEPPFYVDGAHFEMILEHRTLEKLVGILSEDSPYRRPLDRAH